MKHKGMLIVISGFSGAGKGTVVKGLVKEYGYKLSISATTRSPREGEVHGREYFFKATEEFKSMIEENGFIEWAQYVEHYYGTPRRFVEEELENGSNVILEIEVQGAMKIKEQYPDALLLFITTKDADTLEQRLVGRGTETMETIQKRLFRAAEEAEEMKKYEYLVINDDLNECIEQIHQIVQSESKRISNQQCFIEEMKENLKALKERSK